MARVVVPAAGHVITIHYQVNGWAAGGTGLLDEDGRPSHAWLGKDVFALKDASSNAAADLRAFLGELAANYFSAMKLEIDATFKKAGRAPVMYVGPDTLGTWTSTPRKEVLQAASHYLDFALMGGAAGYTLTQPMLDFMAQWYGRPILSGVFMHANQDSPFFKSPGEQDYRSQEARGTALYALIRSMLTSTASSGVNPYLGYAWWQYGDNWGEQTNWGLVTRRIMPTTATKRSNPEWFARRRLSIISAGERIEATGTLSPAGARAIAA